MRLFYPSRQSRLLFLRLWNTFLTFSYKSRMNRALLGHFRKPGNTTFRKEIVSCRGFTQLLQTKYQFFIIWCYVKFIYFMVEIGTILIQISSPYAKKKFRADQCPLMVVFYMTLHWYQITFQSYNLIACIGASFIVHFYKNQLLLTPSILIVIYTSV